jgi:O-antigen ligase
MAAQDLSIENPHERSGTSVGARLAMWDISFQIFREHPVVGIGPTRFQAELHRKNTEQYRSADIYTQNVAHQEFLDAMARAGILGGIALAALFAYPLIALYRQRKTRPAWRSMGGLGVLGFLGSFLLFGLANTTLTNHTSLLFFIIAMSVLWAQYLQETEPV